MGEPAMERWTVAEKDAKVLANASYATFQKELAAWERKQDAAKKKGKKITDLKPKCQVQPVALVRPKLKNFLEGGSDEEAADDADDDEEGADGEESEGTASEAQSPTWHYGIQHTGCAPHVSLNNNCDLSTLSSKLLTTCAIFTQFLPNYQQTVASMYTLLIFFFFFCYFNVFVLIS